MESRLLWLQPHMIGPFSCVEIAMDLKPFKLGVVGGCLTSALSCSFLKGCSASPDAEENGLRSLSLVTLLFCVMNILVFLFGAGNQTPQGLLSGPHNSLHLHVRIGIDCPTNCFPNAIPWLGARGGAGSGKAALQIFALNISSANSSTRVF